MKPWWKNLICSLTWLALCLGPVGAQASEKEPVSSQEVRVIPDPDALAPPRVVPLEEVIPSVTDPALAVESLRLDLRGAMSLALSTTPSLERIRSKIRQTQYQVDEAYTLVNPTATFQAQYSRVEPPVSITGGTVISPTDNYQFSLTLRQAIYTFGRLKWNVLANKLSKRVVEEEYRTEVNRLVALVAETYIDVLLSQERVTIAQDNLESQLANLRISRLLYEQGVVARFDVLRTSAAASQAQQTLIEAETGEQLARARLLSLLDEPLDRKLRLEGLSIYAPKDDISLNEFKLKALETRPDLRSVRWAVEAAKAQVEVAETSNNPSLELQNTTINRNATGFSPGTQNTTALVLSVPLFDGGVSHYQKEQALESVTQLTEDLEQLERDAVLQIEEVHQQLIDQWRAISVAEETVTQADEALRVAVLRYENGISTNVELLDSQAERSEARFRLSQARGKYLASRWNWWRVTAGEYPVEVPFSPEMRARLDAEGIPAADEAFQNTPSAEGLKSLLPIEEAPPLPIRGLPNPTSE
jgi:outer membrane protein TolC